MATVADHGGTERAKSFFADFDRSRNVEFDVSHKAIAREIFHKARVLASGVFGVEEKGPQNRFALARLGVSFSAR